MRARLSLTPGQAFDVMKVCDRLDLEPEQVRFCAFRSTAKGILALDLTINDERKTRVEAFCSSTGTWTTESFENVVSIDQYRDRENR